MKIAILSMISIVASVFLFISCDDKLDVLQAYGFTLTTMPVQKRIKQGETAEIRCQLNKSGNYKEAKFDIGYFQPDGKGTLEMDDGTVFLSNDTYPLDRETFRLFYTSECTDQQTIDITIYDNFGQKYELSLSFQNDN